MSAGRSSHNSRGVDRKASGSSDNSKFWDVRETRKPFDATHKVHEIPFNCKRKRMDKKIRKPQKQKKKKSSSKPVKQRRLLLGSHLLGFNEGYGDGLYPPCDVEIGRKQLIRLVKDILEGHHIPVIAFKDIMDKSTMYRLSEDAEWALLHALALICKSRKPT
ncbi:hypothetical protein Tco_1009552 [Tanacetum coccineum]